MYPLIGSIIRDERIKQNIKQDVLCHKICSPSYLSKIESNHANPSDDILVLLFERLNIKYTINIAQETISSLFNKVSNYAFYEEYNLKITEELLEELNKYRYSKYYWEIYIHELLLIDTTSGFKISPSLPEKFEYHPFVSVLYAQTHTSPNQVDDAIRRLLLSQGQDNTGIVDLSLSQSYFFAGKFEKSYESAQKSLSTFASLGNIRKMMYAHFQMGNTIIYSSFSKALYHFESCRRIAKLCNDSQIIYDLDYNLAADYLDLYFKNENIDDLLIAKDLILKVYASSYRKSFYHFEKIILIHLYLDEKESAANYFEEIRLYDETWIDTIEYQALQYAVSHPIFYLDRDYANLIESILEENIKYNIYTRTIFMRNMLRYIYIKQKRYKPALNLTNFPH